VSVCAEHQLWEKSPPAALAEPEPEPDLSVLSCNVHGISEGQRRRIKRQRNQQ
jgi:hypothetical protein